MTLPEEGKLLRIFLGERDKHEGQPLHEWTVREGRRGAYLPVHRVEELPEIPMRRVGGRRGARKGAHPLGRGPLQGAGPITSSRAAPSRPDPVSNPGSRR